MKMRRHGNSGLPVSELCFGAMTFGGADRTWGKVGVNWLAGFDFEIKVAARIPG